MGGRVGRPRGMTTEERFWEKVTKGPDCWEWTGGRVGDGERPDTRYGRFATSTTRGSVVLVLPHRYSWELHYFPVPEGHGNLSRLRQPGVRSTDAPDDRHTRCKHADDEAARAEAGRVTLLHDGNRGIP
jgi:hypothetical protein